MTDHDALRGELARLLEDARTTTTRLVQPLDDDDLHRQHVPFLSPVVWDLAHVGNFEELWLLRTLGGTRVASDDMDALYNAFESPRPVRGSLPLLRRDEAADYVAAVRHEVLTLLARIELDPAQRLLRDGKVHRMIAQHESQHQETILQAIGMRADVAPHPLADRATCAPARRPVDDTARVTIDGGPFVMGTDAQRWTCDNERPAHRVGLPTFALDRYPATARRYAAFMADGGYSRPELWSERGWSWLQEEGHDSPQGWLADGTGGWCVRRLGRRVPLDPAEPVQHISWFEADAFARWAGGRLPTEQEWEKAARWDPERGVSRTYPWGEEPPTRRRANVGLAHAGPCPVGSYPAGAAASGAEQLVGDVYEWTSSGWHGYPGFEAFPYREYSEVFFGGDYRVLRGASWAIGRPMARATYRNWDHPYRRQIMAGVRVAWDVPAPPTGR